MERPENQNQERVQALQAIVEQRRICYDVFRERVGFEDAASRTVGYELVLSGIHSPGSHPPQPGCDLCRDVYEDLKEIAQWILPKEHRPSFYEIEPYRPIIRATRKRKLREEVTLSIRILHRDHYQDPVDDCETRCLVEMEGRLKQIRVCEGEWQPPPMKGIRRD